MNPFGKIKKKSLYCEEICKKIEQAIIYGELLPGERIVESRLAKQLGVSQAPVREAMKELERIGYVEKAPHQGCVVRRVTVKEFLLTCQIRRIVARIGTEEACDKITGYELEKLKSCLENLEIAATSGDYVVYASWKEKYYRQIIEASHNRMLNSIWEQCVCEEVLFKSEGPAGRNRIEPIIRNKMIVEAIERGEKEKAVNEVLKHIDELEKEGKSLEAK